MEENNREWLKFYGLNDYATFFKVQHVMEYLDKFDDEKSDYTLGEIIELHNALQFIEKSVFPNDYTDEQRAGYKALIPKIKKTVVLFFKSIDEASAESIITEIDYNYRKDLLHLLTANRVHERVPATMLLLLLKNAGVGIRDLLANKTITDALDQDIRLIILADKSNAELLIYKYLEAGGQREVNLPPSLKPDDSHELIERYLDGDSTNPNYVRLVAESRVNKTAGIDAKLKLKAKRKHDATNEEFFRSSTGGMTVATEVILSDDQEEPVKIENDGSTTRYTYSKNWFEEHASPAEIINIFINLFAFVHEGMILSLPAFKAELGVFERFMGVKGKEAYPAGVAFQFREQSAFLQTVMYDRFLRNRDRQLEDVITWFFNEYLEGRFGVEGFRYAPSSKTSTYLERSRHVFTEMESVIKQFALYVENNEIDKELLAITSEQVRYHDIPSQIPNKYYYAASQDDITIVQHYLFSDQAGLGYISDMLSADTLFKLLISKDVSYDDFHDYQKPSIDRLISLNVLEKAGQLIKFRSEDQLGVLKNLYSYEALSYHHYTDSMRSEIDKMVVDGWLIAKSSLLTSPEASYFNYHLNQSEFSDGYDLRNKYLHGSQADKEDENAHYKTYITALKLMMILVMKMSSDFQMKDALNK